MPTPEEMREEASKREAHAEADEAHATKDRKEAERLRTDATTVESAEKDAEEVTGKDD